MDPDHLVLSNMRDVVGCSGLRNFTDLGRMRQDTLEKRLTAVQGRLNRDSVACIYTAWLCNQYPRPNGDAKVNVLKRWSGYINLSGCSKFRATCLWDTCVDRALEGMKDAHINDFIMEMDEVRDFILEHYPDPIPQLCQYPAIDVESIQTLQPEPKRELSNSPPHSLKRKNIFSLTLDLKKDSGDDPAADTGSDFETASRLSDTISPIPKSYRCRRCLLAGHLVKDCPANLGRSFDRVPEPDYVCHLCGTEGDHYIYSCPKDKYKTASTSPPSRKRSAPADDDEHPGRIVIGEKRDGRLSPWGSSSIHNSGYSEEPSPSNNVVKKAEERAQDFLNNYEPSTSFTLASAAGMTAAGFENGPCHYYNSSYKRPRIDGWTWSNQETQSDVDNSHWGARVSVSDEVDAPEHTYQEELEPMSPNAGYTPTSPDFRATYRYSSLPLSSSVSEPELPTPPQAYVTTKEVGCPPYDAAVVEIFGDSDNTWINTCPRPTALDMWDVKEE
ncbi:hypothetical protein AK830_g7669 [Neonectria ditissima]|uniref:CCHC-type domain-containing protein n=1 Tax=Neonectria ditissima TaxID=78410 RepID=A0A0P7AWK3_9HYPO|nr:hypothetical protein AK830_g7669 [Neonectria ditissima]